MFSIPTLVSLFLLAVPKVVLADPCVVFDANFNLLAFGFDGKDYSAGQQSSWSSGKCPFSRMFAVFLLWLVISVYARVSDGLFVIFVHKHLLHLPCCMQCVFRPNLDRLCALREISTFRSLLGAHFRRRNQSLTPLVGSADDITATGRP